MRSLLVKMLAHLAASLGDAAVMVYTDPVVVRGAIESSGLPIVVRNVRVEDCVPQSSK